MAFKRRIVQSTYRLLCELEVGHDRIRIIAAVLPCLRNCCNTVLEGREVLLRQRIQLRLRILNVGDGFTEFLLFLLLIFDVAFQI